MLHDLDKTSDGTVVLSMYRDGGGCLYAVIQTESRITPEQYIVRTDTRNRLQGREAVQYTELTLLPRACAVVNKAPMSFSVFHRFIISRVCKIVSSKHKGGCRDGAVRL